MAIVKKLSDYTLRGGTGGYSVEGWDPRLRVGQVNELLYSPRGGYSMASGRAGQEFSPNLVPGSKGFSEDEKKRMLELLGRSLGAYTQNTAIGPESRFSGPRTKEINTKAGLRAADAAAEANALKADVDALAALRKNAPKDKLGNTIETPEMAALSRRIQARMVGGGTVGKQGNLKDYGVTDKQISAINEARVAAGLPPLPGGTAPMARGGSGVPMTELEKNYSQSNIKSAVAKFDEIAYGSSGPRYVPNTDAGTPAYSKVTQERGTFTGRSEMRGGEKYVEVRDKDGKTTFLPIGEVTDERGMRAYINGIGEQRKASTDYVVP